MRHTWANNIEYNDSLFVTCLMLIAVLLLSVYLALSYMRDEESRKQLPLPVQQEYEPIIFR